MLTIAVFEPKLVLTNLKTLIAHINHSWGKEFILTKNKEH